MNRKPKLVDLLPTVFRKAKLMEFYGGKFDGKPFVVVDFADIEAEVGLTVANARFMAQSILELLKDEPADD